MIEEALMAQRMCNFWNEEVGQDLIEYSLLICFIAIAVMFIMGTTRPAVNAIWQSGNSDLAQGLAAASGS
jgi:Flp pilus assembly pilin Flp